MSCGGRASAVASPPVSSTSSRSLVGAIRWDAWHGDKGEPGQAVQRALSPKWHYRLPFFAEIVSDDEVRIPATRSRSSTVKSPTPTRRRHRLLGLHALRSRLRHVGGPVPVLGQPTQAGCEVLRHHQSPQHSARAHRASDDRCGLCQGGARTAAAVPVLPDPRVADDAAAHRWVADVRARARHSGLAEPYIVIMGFEPVASKRMADLLGGDAISSYSTSNHARGLPYRDLAQHAERFWDRCGQTGAKVVPIVQTGDDRRPRIERPVPWERYQKPGVGLDHYHQQATPAELAAQAGCASSGCGNIPPRPNPTR